MDELQRDITLQFAREICADCLETKCPEIVKLKLKDDQCSFNLGCQQHSDQIFTLKQIFKKFFK